MRKEASNVRLTTKGLMAMSWALVLSGCAMAPSLSVVGAYFPSWLFCFAGALLLTLIVRSLLMHAKKGRWFGPPAVVNFLLFVMFSLLLWLLFF